MFPTSRLVILVSCGACLLASAISACSTNPAAQAVGSGGEGTENAGAAGQARDDVAAVAGESSGGASSDPSNTDDSSYAGNSEEDGKCRSGQTRCHGELGFQRCTPDGIWGAAQSCGGYSDNGTSSYCAVVDDGGGPWAACIDPACWWWLKQGVKLGDGRTGVCVGSDQVRPCEASSLSRPQPCAGLCRRVGEIDGRVLGYCDDACAEGERECLTGPLYRECVNGRWSTTTRACDDGELCQPRGDQPHSDVQCGGACAVGTSRCGSDGASVERCADDGSWEAPVLCLLGRCVHDGAQAQCQTECQPGEHACERDGASSELTCGELGLWSGPLPCEEGARCRVGVAGALGCLACVGPELAGGNSWGVTDSRCVENGVASCGADNVYAPEVACGEGQACVEVARGAATLAYCK